jgi:hypothetical protein
MPGDMANAGNRLANCTGTCATAGDGNSIVGTALTSKTGTYAVANNNENRTFWLHLAVARLISGVDASGAQGPAWGVEYPAARIGGGFHVVFTAIPQAGAIPAVSGHYAVLRNSAGTGNVSEPAGASAISPLRAAQIDRKMDDGLPQTGDVVGVGTANCTGTGTPPAYNETQEVRDCNLLIRVQG